MTIAIPIYLEVGTVPGDVPTTPPARREEAKQVLELLLTGEDPGILFLVNATHLYPSVFDEVPE